MSEDSNELVIIMKIMMMMIIIMMVVGQTSRPICWSVSGSREEVASSRIRSLLPLHNTRMATMIMNMAMLIMIIEMTKMTMTMMMMT